MTTHFHSLHLSRIKRALLLLFILSFGTLYSQNTFIKGSGVNIGGKTVRLLTYADRISFLEQDTGSYTVPDNDSVFQFSIILTHPIEAIMRIEMYDYHFILEPEKHYTIHVDSFPYTMDNGIDNPMLFNYPLPASIVCHDNNDLNRKLYFFNNAIDSFIHAHANKLSSGYDKTYTDSLDKFISTYYNDQDSGYFETYVRGHVAASKYAYRIPGNSKNIKQIFGTYPIPYENMGYMELFNLYYSQYFTHGRGKLTKEHFRHWIHNNMYHEMMDSLGSDPMLRNEVLREMAFLKGMSEAFHDSYYNSQAVLNIISRLHDETKFPQHRHIARNLLQSLRNKRLKGADAPNFCLTDTDSNQHCLNTYFGNPIYLSFVKLKERASLLELETMKHFHPKRTNNCIFITVVCDREFATMYNFLKNSKAGSQYSWLFLHLNNDYKLLETYGARTFPFFVSIDAHGKISASPAKDPKEGGYCFQ